MACSGQAYKIAKKSYIFSLNGIIIRNMPDCLLPLQRQITVCTCAFAGLPAMNRKSTPLMRPVYILFKDAGFIL